eukprot:930471_1
MRIRVKRPDQITSRFPHLRSQKIMWSGVKCVLHWCYYCCYKPIIGNKYGDLKNGSIIPSDTRGPLMWKYTEKCYKHVSSDGHMDNFLTSKIRGIGNKGKETMKRLIRIIINNVRNGASYMQFEKDVVHAYLQDRVWDPNRYGNRYHGRATAEQVVKLGGVAKLKDIHCELNTPLPATQDYPHYSFSMDGISAAGTSTEPLAISRRQPNGLMAMSTVGVNFKIYDPNRSVTQSTAHGTAAGVYNILMKQVKLRLDRVINYNMSNTLDGKYKKLNFETALKKVINYGSYYWCNWCKMHIVKLSGEELDKNCGVFALTRKFINKLCAHVAHKTGEQVSKYLG